MALTDLMPEEDEFDLELAIECGLTPEQEDDAHWDTQGKWSRFRYIQDQWECENCDTLMWHVEGKKYYWNPRSGNYDGSKPLTPKERARKANQRQEKAGQLRLMDELFPPSLGEVS